MISSIISFFTKLFFITETINLTNPIVFQTVGNVTMGMSKDIYPSTQNNIDYDDDFAIFETQPQYLNQGKIVKKIAANAKEYMPKMLIYDWKGNEATQINGARILVIRGTQSYNEWVGNLDCKEVSGKELGIDIEGVFHKNFGEVALKIWKQHKKFILKSPYPVIITGHSRGAGIAEILYVIAKNEIMKKKKKLPIYCMAYAPPPTMALNDTTNSKELTNDIHAFVNGNDAVPRFFVNDFMNYYNKFKKVSNAYNYASSFIQIGFKISTSQSTSSKITKDDAIKMGKIIADYFPQINKSIIINAVLDKKDDLYKIMEELNFDPNNIKIVKHVGNIYQIDIKKYSKDSDNDDKCKIKPFIKLEDPKELSQLNMIKFWQINSFVKDHNPKYYHQAFIYPTCSI